MGGDPMWMVKRAVGALVVISAAARLSVACTGDDPTIVERPADGGPPISPSTPTPTAQSCDAGTTPCGGSCVDLAIDPLNCGRCGRDCGGGLGSCSVGECSAQTLANNFKGAHGVAVDDTHVYFTVASYAALPGEVVLAPVSRIPKRGGVPEPLSATERAPVMITSFGGEIFWTNWDDATIRGAGVAGGAVRTLLDAGGGVGPFDIHAASAGLYWTEVAAPSRVRFLAWDASAPTVLAALPQRGVTSLALDDSSAYFTVQDDPTSVRRVALTGGGDAGVSLVSAGARPWGLTIDAAYVYFTETNGGTLKRIPKAGGAITVLATNLDGPRSVVVDGAYAYVAEFALAGHVYRIPITGLDGGAPTTMASNQGAPIGLTQDADFLYWANNADGRIMRVRK